MHHLIDSYKTAVRLSKRAKIKAHVTQKAVCTHTRMTSSTVQHSDGDVQPVAQKFQCQTRLALRLVASLFSLAMASVVHAENCTVRLSDQKIDYGELNSASLSSTTQNGKIVLGKRLLTINIDCQESTTFTLQFNAPAADKESFRFSNTGTVSMSLAHAQVDGKAVMLAAEKTTDNAPSHIAAVAKLVADQPVTGVSDSLPVSGKTFTAQVEVEAQIAPATLRVREFTHIEEVGTFVLIKR